MNRTVPSCRFCNAPFSQQSIKGQYVYGGSKEQHFWKCQECSIMYLHPPLSEKDEARFYKQEFEKYMEGRTGKDKDWSGPERHFASNQGEASRRMGFLESYLKQGQNVLEIGCSSGFMLSALKARRANVCGLDTSEIFSEYIRSKGIDVSNNIEELRPNHSKPFDLILHYYVLEHIRNPVEFIIQYMLLLHDEGQMIFEVPCATDPLIELYRISSFDKFYWSVAHHWYFNKESLAAVLKQTGFNFELFPEQRYDLSNHLTWMIEGVPGGMGRYTHIFGTDLEEAYKKRLKENWLCDTIIAVVWK